jgi:hypothetical protein
MNLGAAERHTTGSRRANDLDKYFVSNVRKSCLAL